MPNLHIHTKIRGMTQASCYALEEHGCLKRGSVWCEKKGMWHWGGWEEEVGWDHQVGVV